MLHELIRFAETTAHRQKLPKLTLYTNVAMTKNRAIYSHLGFSEVSEQEAPGGYRIVFMERPVA